MWERVLGQPSISAALVERLLSFSTQGLAVSIMALSGLEISDSMEMRCIRALGLCIYY